MEYRQLSDIKAKIKRDLYLQDATFVEDSSSAPELLDYINEAIDDVEAEVHTTYEDYFLTPANISLVAGTKDYSLPSNIYANKIRGIVYSTGSIIYPVSRNRSPNQFEEQKVADLYAPGGMNQNYTYTIINTSAATGVQLRIFPTPQETTANALEIWFVRNANKLASDTDKCDVPEFVNYVIQFVKVRIYEKEMHPNLQQAMIERERLRKLMQETLADMVPDEDTFIYKDFSVYDDMS